MQVVLALAFLALARAAIIEVPKTIISGEIFPKANLINPLWTTSMFEKYGLAKPMFSDMVPWGKSIGVEEPWMLDDMRSLYEKPALVFFQDPTGKIISFYAHEGIDKTGFNPEMKNVFTGLYDSSDKLAIDFHPEHMLGHYKHVLPGRLFEPVKTIELNHFLNDMPSTIDHVTFKPHSMMKKFWNKIDIDALPMIYKEPVPLDIHRKFLTDSVVPFTHATPFTGFSDFSAAVPFGKSGIIGGSHMMPFTGFRSALGAAPAVKSPAFHLVKADMPFFTAAPTASFVDSAAIPLVKSGLFSEAPVHAIADAPAGHFIAPHAAGASLVKAVPCVGCIGAEHAFAPAATAGVPLVKTLGEAGLTSFGASGAFRSALPATFAEPASTLAATPVTFGASPVTFGASPVTLGASPILKAAPAAAPLFVDPAVGLTGFTSGIGASPITGWGKFF